MWYIWQRDTAKGFILPLFLVNVELLDVLTSWSMLVKHNILAIQSPASTAGITVAGASDRGFGDPLFRTVLHPRNGKGGANGSRDGNAWPGRPYQGKIIRERGQIRRDNCPLFGEGQETGAGMPADDAEPHFKIFGAVKITGDVDSEEPGRVGHVKIGVEFLFHMRQICTGDGKVFRIGIADAGTQAFDFPGIAALLKTGFAGLGRTGFPGRQGERRNRAGFAVALGNMNTHVMIPSFVARWDETTGGKTNLLCF